MKKIFIKFCKLFTSLKSMWWTHVLAWGTNISLLVYIVYIMLGCIFCEPNHIIDILDNFFAAIVILGFFYMIANYFLLFVIAGVFIIEMITLFHFKITNKFILTNPVYNIFWITGFVSFLISSCITIFYLKIL